MKLLLTYIALALLLVASVTDARRRRRKLMHCWTCENAESNEDCLENGELKKCRFNQKACQNTVRTFAGGRMTITKECIQAEACQNNYQQNLIPAWSPPQCDLDRPDTVCRCCCGEKECNKEGLDCAPKPSPTASLPQKLTVCQMKREEATEKQKFLPDTHIPDCQDDGLFNAKQCFWNGCWCVDPKTGERIEGSGEEMSPGDFDSFTCNKPQGITCEPEYTSLENGGVECTDRNNIDSHCTFTCNEGHRISGIWTTICDLTPDGLGVWHTEPPTCKPFQGSEEFCRPIAALENGIISCTDPIEHKPSSVCRFLCNEGFRLIGRSKSTCKFYRFRKNKWHYNHRTPKCVPERS